MNHGKIRKILAEYFESSLPREVEDKIITWLMYDEGHRPEMDEELEKLFETQVVRDKTPSVSTIEAMERMKKRLDLPPVTLYAKPKGRTMPLSRIVMRVASVLVPLVVVAGAAYLGWFRKPADDRNIASNEAHPAVVQTLAGVQKDIRLPDSTRVWIDSESTLTFPVGFDGERHVRLEGRAYFDVRHDAQRPFYVHTEHLTVRVLGTEFDVSAYAGADVTEVALYRGSVEVIAQRKTRRLIPGQRLTYDNRTRGMVISATETPTGGHWRSDEIVATQKPIAELLRMIGNYYDTEIVLDPASSGNELYSISFGRGQSATRVLGLLSAAGDLQYEIRGDTIYVTIR